MEPLEMATKELDDRNLFEMNESVLRTALTSKTVVFKRTKITYQDDVKLNSNTTDVTLIIDSQKLSAHKNVLSFSCDYFDRMFTGGFKEQNQCEVEINIPDISYETLKTLVIFFYNSNLTITDKNVQDLLISSNILLLEDVKKTCADFLKSMINVENCISIKNIANALKLNDLYLLCFVFIINNFSYVAKTENFMTLSFDEIMLLLKSDYLFAKEKMVYNVIMNWVECDLKGRFKHTIDLLWFIRMPLILNTYQGVKNSYELQNAKIYSNCSFRLKYRKPFKKGILMFSHEQSNLSPEWYDATSEQWYDCENKDCTCKTFQVILALPKRLSRCIVLNDGRLFAAGGFEAGEKLKSANIFDLKLNRWVSLISMTSGRTRPYILQIGSKVFAIGGGNRSMEYYDLIKKMWFPVYYDTNKFEVMKKNFYVTSINESIYFIGTNRAEFYNLSNRSWNPIPALPDQRENAAICTLYGNIYIIGGYSSYGYLKSVLAFCTETKLWVSIADMNFPRSNSGAVVMNGLIYVFGGNISSNVVSNTIEVYNPHANEWVTSNACMNKNRCIIDAVVINKASVLYKGVFKKYQNIITH